MDLNDIPRDSEGLSKLARGTRFRLFMELVDEDENSEERDAGFLKLDSDKQVGILLSLLQRYDQNEEEAASGFLVDGVVLPKRSSSKKVNKRRWQKFVNKVEAALNYVQSTHQGVNIVSFNTYGVLITGHRSSSVPTPPFPFPGMAPGFSRPVSMKEMTEIMAGRPLPETVEKIEIPRSEDSKLADHDRERLLAICNQAHLMIRLTTNEDVLNKNLDTLVDGVMGNIGAEMTKSFIVELQRFMMEHSVVGEPSANCGLMTTFSAVKVRFERRVQLGTN